MTVKRVLICGNPDLNFIDGSSIWLQTIALVTATTGAQVQVLARSAPQRDELFGPLDAKENITILDGSDRQYWKKGFARITPTMMGELAIKLDRIHAYDVIIVRGMEIATALLEAPDVLARCWMYLTDIPQSAEEYEPEQKTIMQRIARGCQRLLCQSEGFKTLWLSVVPDIDAAKIRLYTPVVPDFPDALLPLHKRPARAIYAGKFTGDWMTLEMAELWPAIRNQLPDGELVMIGDKFHVEQNQQDFPQRMRRALEHTNGLSWLGPQPRDVVQQRLQEARVGLSWRSESMNETLEYSTKILEYGRAGCAVILNRNPLHEQLLGSDYPFYANDSEEFVRKLVLALNDSQLAELAASRLRDLAAHHAFSTRVDEMRHWLLDTPKIEQKTYVLVAGHDLKFFTLLQKKLEATGRFIFLIDQWQGHNKHDESQSSALLAQADVIFCEWCLGNLQWYSHHKKPHQRLVARFHLQERELPYVAKAKWENIDHISYVSEFIRREGQKAFGFPFEKTSVIPNLLDESKFTPKKKTGDADYTLGIIGVVPARKRLDRALDLLEVLLEEDNRYCLRVKGKHPLEDGWLLNRETEMTYYRNLFERINSSPKLRHKVIFDPPGDDVNEWLTMVGFVLSPSDFESFHMAIGEGMLANTTPVIWNWDGAAEIWGGKWVVSGLEGATKAVMDNDSALDKREELISRMSCKDVVDKWRRVIVDEGPKEMDNT